jgi:predicted RNA binding protein YcfA (HicA-like mRNA interferase family)
LGRLRPLPYREVKRRLEAAGFFEASQKGSHVKFVRRLGETVDTEIVPKKREIAVGSSQHPQPSAH